MCPSGPIFLISCRILENNGQEVGFHPNSKVDNPCEGNPESATDEVQNFGEFKLFEQDGK